MDFYTALVLITGMVLVLSIIDIRSSRVINDALRRNGTITCLLIGLTLFFEWVGVKTNGAPAAWIPVHRLAKLAEFCLAPPAGCAGNRKLRPDQASKAHCRTLRGSYGL